MEDDCEMECDFISRPSTTHGPSNSSEGLSQIEQNDSDRPVTPPNNLEMFPDSCLTPMSNIENDEPSFIKRVGFDRFNKHQRFTSTPLFMHRPKFAHSMPTATQTSQLSNDLRSCKSVENIRPINAGSEQIFIDYINPFTPDGKVIANKVNAQKRMKRLSINAVRRIDTSDSTDSDAASLNDSNDFDVPCRPRLSEFNVSRFNEEFVHLQEIGKGVHGCVYKCLNRMNGCVYAIKRTIKPIRSSIQERIIRNEIYAHAVLDHPNVVRNFSCWKEDGFVFIQNEFCNGGSLEDYLKTNVMSEALLRSLLLQMANALRYIHKKELAHMDIKPGNILIAMDKTNKTTESIESDGGFSDEDKPDELVFKLGDLGHITKLDEKNDVEEGDCRYLPLEILEENYTYLDRADIFALGLTVYEAAGGGPLPKNGDEWQDIRKGILKNQDQLSDEFNSILAAMVQPCADKRPSAAELIQMVKPNPPSPPPDEMFGYLRQYRLNNTVLEHKVEATGQYLRVLFKSHKQLQEQLGKEKFSVSSKDKLAIGKKKGGVTKTRIVGKKTKRSSSTTTF